MAGAGAPEAPDVAALGRRVAGLPALPTAALQQAWTAARGAPPPKGARRRFLLLGIASAWQAAALGGPSRRLARRLSALEAAYRSGRSVAADRRPRALLLMPGTRLVRDWRGVRHEVQVVEGGFLWRGRTRTSLSAIASEIAGSQRNGPAFFGLRNGGGR